MGADMEDQGRTVERMIFYAARAGAFRKAGRDYPESRETFEAAASVNSARVGALMLKIAMARGSSLGANRIGG